MRILAQMIAVAGVAVQMLPAQASAQIMTFTDETAFLDALASQGYVAVHESFEDDAAWGAARSPNTAPSVANLGITWTSSSPNNEITTGNGSARTGAWGFYSLPHGDYQNGITDGWRGTADQSLVAIGGWVDTNTPPAALVVFLDGDQQNAIDFGGANVLGGPYKFFGVIDPNGFSVFDFRETEGTIGDQKFIFSDDFTFAFGGVIADCNQNGVADAFDIAAATSTDCNHNGAPDECEIDVNSPAPGGPFFCTDNCAPECNNNGILDACEVVTADIYASSELSPIGHAAPQSFTVLSPPVTRADVILSFTAYANLGGAPDHISVDINGIAVGTVFGPDGSDCPEIQPDSAQLLVSMETFNDAVSGGDAVIHMIASIEVDPVGCDLPTYITVEAQLFIPSEDDTNENGIPDECESPADLNGDLVVDAADLALLLGAWGPNPGNPADINGDGVVNASDLALLLGTWGP